MGVPGWGGWGGHGCRGVEEGEVEGFKGGFCCVG